MRHKTEIVRVTITKIRMTNTGEVMHGFGATIDNRTVYVPARIILTESLQEGHKYPVIVHKSDRPNSSDLVATALDHKDNAEKLADWLDGWDDLTIEVDAVLEKMEELGLIEPEAAE